MIQPSIFCADVGSIKAGNFGWAASLSSARGGPRI